MDEPEDISHEAMSIMHAVAYDRSQLPMRIGGHMLSRLSEYECLVIDKAIRKAGLTLDYRTDQDEFTIRDTDA